MDELSNPSSSQKSSFTQKNINTIDFNSPKRVKPNTPRTIAALNQLGYTVDDLYYISFKQFKQLQPDIQRLPEDVQVSRHEFFESRRMERIEQVKGLRNTIQIDNASKTLSSKTRSISGESKIQPTAIKNDLKALDQLKKKQEMEMLSMVQYELKRELMRKENEEKARIQKEKEEKNLKELKKQRRIEEEKKRQKEREMIEAQKKEDERRRKEDAEKYNEEQRRLKQEEEMERQRLIENKKKEELDKRKREEFQKKIDRMLEENKRRIDEKFTYLEAKEKERKEILDKKKQNQMREREEKSLRKKQLIENNRINLEDKLNSTREMFLHKQKQNEEKKKKYEELRQMAFREEKMKSEQRAIEIKKVIANNEMMIKEKMDNYYKKQNLIQSKKEQLEEIKKQEQSQHLSQVRLREEKIKQTLQMNKELENERKSVILSKIEKKNESVHQVNQLREREHMERSEELTRKRMDREENRRRISRLQEYERMQTYERLMEKSQRVDEFTFQKSVIANKKRQLQDEISRKKQEYVEKFGKIFKKKNFDEETIRTLQEMFPGNNEINEMIYGIRSVTSEKSKVRSKFNFTTRENNFKESTSNQIYQKEMNKTTSDYFRSNNSSAKTNAPQSGNPQRRQQGKDIEPKQQQVIGDISLTKPTQPQEKLSVNEYRLKLNKDLLVVLSTERQKEENRERALANAKNQDEKRKLEKIFGIERAEASSMIVKLNEEIERKIAEYEKSLHN